MNNDKLINEVNKISGITEQLDNMVKEVGEIKLPSCSSTTGVITFTSDDGRSTFLTSLKPLFDEYGIKCTLAIPTSTVGDSTHLSWEELRILQNDGHEISSHSHGNIDFDIKSISEIKTDTETSLKLFKDNNLNVDTIIYPGGFKSNDKIKKDTIKGYFKCGVSGGQNEINDTPIETIYLKRYDWGKIYTIGNFKTLVDKAIETNTWLIFMMHDWQDTVTLPDRQALLRECLDYLKTVTINVETIRGGVKKIGNVFEVGDKQDNFTALSKLGEFFATSNFMYKGISNTVGKTIVEYETGLSIYRHGSSSTDRPENNTLSGWSITMRDKEDTSNSYSIQLYIPVNFKINKILKRSWDNVNSVWGVWQNISVYTYNDNELSNLDTPLTDFPYGITIQLNKYNSLGTRPTVNSAMVYTHRLGVSNDLYAYQEWKASNTTSIWRRNWNNTTLTWGVWEQH